MRTREKCGTCDGSGCVESDVPNMQCDECGGDGYFCSDCGIPWFFCDCEDDEHPAQQQDGSGR